MTPERAGRPSASRTCAPPRAPSGTRSWTWTYVVSLDDWRRLVVKAPDLRASPADLCLQFITASVFVLPLLYIGLLGKGEQAKGVQELLFQEEGRRELSDQDKDGSGSGPGIFRKWTNAPCPISALAWKLEIYCFYISDFECRYFSTTRMGGYKRTNESGHGVYSTNIIATTRISPNTILWPGRWITINSPTLTTWQAIGM